MPLQAVEPQRLYRQIAEQLRSLIVQGEFALGQRMPAERDLATQLGVSRPSVREALIPLEVMSARLVVESEVAALAATHAQKADIQAMREGLAQMREAAARQEVPRHGDEAVHAAIAQACGNGVLLDTVQRYWQARDGQLFERLGDYFESPESWQAAIAEHEQVLAAIEAGDPASARKAMNKHLKQAHKRYSANW